VRVAENPVQIKDFYPTVADNNCTAIVISPLHTSERIESPGEIIIKDVLAENVRENQRRLYKKPLITKTIYT
jgi:hypothetical protein